MKEKTIVWITPKEAAKALGYSYVYFRRNTIRNRICENLKIRQNKISYNVLFLCKNDIDRVLSLGDKRCSI